MTRTARRGVARIDLLLCAVCGLVMVAATTVAIDDGGNGARSAARSTRDATQLKQIHKAFIIFSAEFRGIYPRPGLFDRLPVDMGNGLQEIPGRGEEDTAQNTTAALYSALIMQNYFTSELVVSPVERNPRVETKKDFDYDLYDPGKDDYWDPAFLADLENRSHTSYAHLVIFGDRAKHEWRETMNAAYPVIGNRGPKAGERDFKSYTCGPHGHWTGNLVFNDNHTELLASMEAAHLKVDRDGKPTPDNYFAMETGPGGGDVIITYTSAMGPAGATIQHD